MNSPLPDWIVLAVWHSLLGEIYPSIRAIAVAFREDKCLLIRYYLDRDPVDMDYEGLEVLATNISSSTGQSEISDIEIDCQFSSEYFMELDSLDGFIYCGREYSMG